MLQSDALNRAAEFLFRHKIPKRYNQVVAMRGSKEGIIVRAHPALLERELGISGGGQQGVCGDIYGVPLVADDGMPDDGRVYVGFATLVSFDAESVEKFLEAWDRYVKAGKPDQDLSLP